MKRARIHGLWWLQQNLLWNLAPPKALWLFLRKENHLLSWTPGIDIKAVWSQERGGKVWCITSLGEPSLSFFFLPSLSFLRSSSPLAETPECISGRARNRCGPPPVTRAKPEFCLSACRAGELILSSPLYPNGHLRWWVLFPPLPAGTLGLDLPFQ